MRGDCELIKMTDFIDLFDYTTSHNGAVMLSEALQRNAKHEARLSNISDLFQLHHRSQNQSEILRFAQNDKTRWVL